MAPNLEAIAILRRLGWRVRTTGEACQVVALFQRANTLGRPLVDDGIAGPKTMAALRRADGRRKRGLPTASAHFSFVEFRCKCGGRYSSCARIWITRATILRAERYRRVLGHGVPIVSGCRCPGHNAAVHGAEQSRHLAGDGLDFPPAKPVGWHRKLRTFAGLGYNPSGLVRHGDGGRPRVWRYGS
jgi:hypothetical protein